MECCEVVGGALDGIAVPVVLTVESRWLFAQAAPAEVAVLLAGRLGDRGVGRTSAQGATTSPRGLPADKSFQSHKPLRIKMNALAQPNESLH